MSAKTGYEQALAQLTPKQQMFVREYLVDLNATQAATRAGYSKKTAKEQGSRLLTNVHVQMAVEFGTLMKIEKVEVNADFVLGALLKIAAVDPADAYNEDGSLKNIHQMPKALRLAISGIDVQETTVGEGVTLQTKKLKFWDKRGALQDLGRHLNLFQDNLNVRALGSLSDEELDRRIAQLARG